MLAAVSFLRDRNAPSISLKRLCNINNRKEKKTKKRSPPVSSKAKEGGLNDFVRNGHRRFCQQIGEVLIRQSHGRLSHTQLREKIQELIEFGRKAGNSSAVRDYKVSFSDSSESNNPERNDAREKLGGGEATVCSRVTAALAIICETPEKFCDLLVYVSLHLHVYCLLICI